MKLPVKKIRVFPNPWGIHPRVVVEGGKGTAECMDHVGRPCGVVMQDLVAGGGVSGRLVGAKVDEEFTTVQKQSEWEIRSPYQRTVYKYLGCSAHELEPFQLATELAEKAPLEIPNTAYYRDCIAQGILIAADIETARLAGLPSKFFTPPKDLIPKLAELAAEAFDEQYEGDEAYLHFIAERVEAKKVADELAAKAKADAAAREAAESEQTEESGS